MNMVKIVVDEQLEWLQWYNKIKVSLPPFGVQQIHHLSWSIACRPIDITFTKKCCQKNIPTVTQIKKVAKYKQMICTRLCLPAKIASHIDVTVFLLNFV